MSANDLEPTLFVPGFIALGVIGCTIWYVLERRRGDPLATPREFAWTLAAVILFTLSGGLAATHPRWHWLWGAAIGISLAHTARQFLSFRHARNRARDQ